MKVRISGSIVIMALLVGAQFGATWNCVRTNPSRASASRRGVEISPP